MTIAAIQSRTRLTPSSLKGRLRELETIVERGITAFYEAGLALREIRDSRLYRTEFGTFEEYCKKRWGQGRNYSNKLIAAAEIVELLGTTVPKTVLWGGK